MFTLEPIGLFLVSLIVSVTLSLYLGNLLFGTPKIIQQRNNRPAQAASPDYPPTNSQINDFPCQDSDANDSVDGLLLHHDSLESDETASGPGDFDECNTATVGAGQSNQYNDSDDVAPPLFSEAVKTKQMLFTDSFKTKLKDLQRLVVNEKKFPSSELKDLIQQIEKTLWTDLSRTFPEDRLAQSTTMSICLSHVVHLDVSPFTKQMAVRLCGPLRVCVCALRTRLTVSSVRNILLFYLTDGAVVGSVYPIWARLDFVECGWWFRYFANYLNILTILQILELLHQLGREWEEVQPLCQRVIGG